MIFFQSLALIFRTAFVFPALLLLLPAMSSGEEHDPEVSLEHSRGSYNKDVEWIETASFDFESDANMGEWPVPDGEWEIRDGRLHAIGGDRNRTIFLHKTVGDPVRIEFDCYSKADSLGRLGDITVLLNSLSDKSFFNSGYTCTTGSYWNSCSTIYKGGKRIAHTEFSPVFPEKLNHAILEFNDGHLRYWLNNQILIEATAENLIDMDPERWIGVRTWATDMWIDNFKIFKGKKK